MNDPILIALLVLAGVGVFLCIARFSKGPRRRLDQLGRPLVELLERGFDGGILIIDVAGREEFVQFRKYIRVGNDAGIELGFPRTDWSENYYEDVEAILGTTALELRKVDNGMPFLLADFRTDVDSAYLCLRRILVEVYGSTPATVFHVLLENARLR